MTVPASTRRSQGTFPDAMSDLLTRESVRMGRDGSDLELPAVELLAEPVHDLAWAQRVKALLIRYRDARIAAGTYKTHTPTRGCTKCPGL